MNERKVNLLFWIIKTYGMRLLYKIYVIQLFYNIKF